MRIRSHPMRRSVHIRDRVAFQSSMRLDVSDHPSYRGLNDFKAYRLPTMPIKLLQYVGMCSQASAEALSGAIYPAHAFRRQQQVIFPRFVVVCRIPPQIVAYSFENGLEPSGHLR